LLLPLLPPSIGVSSGVIISWQGHQSPQMDVIIYDKTLLPPFLLAEKGLIPIEAVLFAIEVKSKLTLEELRDSHLAAATLLTFPALPGRDFLPDEDEIRWEFKSPISAVFAFSSSLTAPGSTELARYEDYLASIGTTDPALFQICVAGREFCRRAGGMWSHWPRSDPHDEVLGFLAAIMNTIPSLSASRGTPSMGRYVSDG